jgi:hypothetical protein
MTHNFQRVKILRLCCLKNDINQYVFEIINNDAIKQFRLLKSKKLLQNKWKQF